MSSPTPKRPDHGPDHPFQSHTPPTRAAFSPTSISQIPSVVKNRSTILVHQKSPLLVATPPQITRALAYSHPFILPLNRFVGLLTWSSPDPWESFLLVACFWLIALYGDTIIRWAGPLCVATVVAAGLFMRRYSPLSSKAVAGDDQGKAHRKDQGALIRQNKSLDEIVETLGIFTARCNVLIAPMVQLTDFLSTQTAATRTSTRPALTRLFTRLLVVTPFWTILALPPFEVVTTRRVVLSIGTVLLTYHSRQARVTRALLWRSSFIRRTVASVTGLSFPIKSRKPPNLPERKAIRKDHSLSATSAESPNSPGVHGRRPSSPGVKFTFTLYENQRRWIGLGWTNSLMAYERAPWTDEHLNPSPPKEEFHLPEVDDTVSRWRWVQKSRWKVENAPDVLESGQLDPDRSKSKAGKNGSEEGWIYYDNKWANGKNKDGWGQYTRRRKWSRDAELVEVTPSTEVTPLASPQSPPAEEQEQEKGYHSEDERGISREDTESDGEGLRTKHIDRLRMTPGSRRVSRSSNASKHGSLGSAAEKDREKERSRGHDEDRRDVEREIEKEWNTMDDAKMVLG